ncbi:M24 family metallopeptidase [Liquorilactobacillus nagelii]|uniref:M24 family metallopeptidase n=1 Tax=Liquorilactobacillus nagelii TaxID=82688 RepID=UPI0039ED158F
MENSRVKKLRKEMQRMHFDGFLVTDPVNRCYMSGFTGDDGVLLITEQDQFLITDWRFERQVEHDCPTWQLVLTRDYLGETCRLAQKKHLSALAFESTINYDNYSFLDENFPADLAAVSAVIESQRSIKSEAEVNIIRESCQLAGRGYQAVLEFLQQEKDITSITEHDVAVFLDQFMQKHGAEDKSFPTIVASGERSTWPHAMASSASLKPQTMVTLDFGYFLHKYTSDVTRTFAIGEQSKEFYQLYQIVQAAQKATIEAIKPGISGKQLDQIGRQIITQAGYGKYFNHGMGHGIGLAIHELPAVGAGSQDVLQTGQIVTIEPGAYVPGVGGVRIEDDILVTQAGYEILTDFNRDYREL